MRVMSVVGARPQFVKLSPIAHAMRGRVEHVIVHTGQHYDEAMSDSFFRDLDIPAPDVNLAVGSGAHGAQTAAMLAGLEPAITEYAPDWVLVYGDTNSTLAAAIAAVKLHVPLAHLESGLRSFNRRMPEEHNRVLTDHAADLCLAPTEVAMGHLEREGLAERSVLVGDVMTDVLYSVRDRRDADAAAGADATSLLPGTPEAGEYYVSTIHRPDNTDDPERLRAILTALSSLPKPTFLLAHPRLRAIAEAQGIDLNAGTLVALDPLAYPQLVQAVRHSAGVVTDSGGLQKEAFLLGAPCTTIRPETEWVETVRLGWNVLADPQRDDLGSIVTRPRPDAPTEQPYGDGHAAERVVDSVLAHRGTEAESTCRATDQRGS